MPEITSPQNERVKRVVRLRERRNRDREGLTLVEGRYELELALRSGVVALEVYACLEMTGDAPSAFGDLNPVLVSPPVFEKMSYRDNPDGWLAVVPIRHRALAALSPADAGLLVLAEAVEKPGNLGAILRTADAARVDGLLVCDPRTDLYNPNVIRASRGTVFTVPVVQTTGAEALDWLRAGRFRILAATPRAEALYTQVDLRGPVCIAVGREDEGLTDFWMDAADLRVRIPMLGKVNSLNVSASTAIILYEAVRQRQRG